MGETFGDEPIINPLRPGHGRLGPFPIGVEPFDDGFVGAAGALLTGCARVSPVEQHSEQPCLERRPPLESLNTAEHGQPGVLAHLLGHGATPDGRLGEPQKTRLVAADHFDERGLVAGAQPIDESEIVIHAARGYDSATPPVYGEKRRVRCRA